MVVSFTVAVGLEFFGPEALLDVRFPPPDTMASMVTFYRVCQRYLEGRLVDRCS